MSFTALRNGRDGLLLAALLASSCGDWASLDLERMLEQRSYKAYERNPRFEDHRAMRPPPPGTVPRGRGREFLQDWQSDVPGVEGGTYLARIPMEIDLVTLRRGRNRYDLFCAVCHSPVGTGDTSVADNMSLKKPPSLVRRPVLGYPPGRIYSAITKGYGLMPAYANQLRPADRWAVVAYVQTLQLSQGSLLSELPEALQTRAKDNLP